jgi:tryptophan synthase alpha chain
MFDALFKNRKVFLGYLTAGHRGLAYTESAALALIAGGVDILEIGLPFSDPIADGPVIQTAMQATLREPLSYHDVLAMISRLKEKTHTPIILFTYYNPLLAIGLDCALDLAKQAGVDGLLIVDLPFEESMGYFITCEKYQLAPINLISPTTSSEKIKKIGQYSRGFLYYVCRHGTTGIQTDLPSDYATQMIRIKNHTSLPIVSGFGIASRRLAKHALEHAAGFVVGSAFVSAMIDGAHANDLTILAKTLDPR